MLLATQGLLIAMEPEEPEPMQKSALERLPKELRILIVKALAEADATTPSFVSDEPETFFLTPEEEEKIKMPTPEEVQTGVSGKERARYWAERGKIHTAWLAKQDEKKLLRLQSLKNAIKNIKQIAQVNKDFASIMKDPTVIDILVTELANHYTGGNKLRVALEFGPSALKDCTRIR